jgi:hypothetical protein
MADFAFGVRWHVVGRVRRIDETPRAVDLDRLSGQDRRQMRSNTTSS